MTSRSRQILARLRHVSKVYGAADQITRALDDVSLEFFSGELTVLHGPSGSGKTTLLSILAGLMPPTAGEVELFGHPVGSYSAAALQHLRAAGLGVVFQTFLLLDTLTVEENIEIVTRFARRERNGVRDEVRSLMHRLGIRHLGRKHPAQLSQGEKQRVAIARAVINKPDLIIADEPTASVDASTGNEIIRLLHGFAVDEGRSVLVTSHDQRVLAYADRAIGMNDGRVSSPGISPAPGEGVDAAGELSAGNQNS